MKMYRQRATDVIFLMMRYFRQSVITHSNEGMRIPRAQKGFTLLEVVCGLAVACLLGAVLTPSIAQMEKDTTTIDARNVAAQNVQAAGHYFCNDAKMAQVTDLSDDAQPLASVTINWMDRYHGADSAHSVNYSLCGTDLIRNYDGNISVVARYISEVGFSLSSGAMTMAVSSHPRAELPDLTIQGIYSATIRAVI